VVPIDERRLVDDRRSAIFGWLIWMAFDPGLPIVQGGHDEAMKASTKEGGEPFQFLSVWEAALPTWDVGRVEPLNRSAWAGCAGALAVSRREKQQGRYKSPLAQQVHSLDRRLPSKAAAQH
jgi:hypothetical protein